MVQAFVWVFLLQEWGSKEKVTFPWGISVVRTGSNEKVRFKIALEPDSRNPVSLPVLNFLMNLIASLWWVFKFVFRHYFGGRRRRNQRWIGRSQRRKWRRRIGTRRAGANHRRWRSNPHYGDLVRGRQRQQLQHLLLHHFTGEHGHRHPGGRRRKPADDPFSGRRHYTAD